MDGKLGEVMPPSPDIDVSVFSQQLRRVDPDHVTVFVSRTDRALKVSSRVVVDRPRLGALAPSNPRDRKTLEALGVSVHDLSRLNTDFVGHSASAEVPAVVRQIRSQLATAEESDEAEWGYFDISEGGNEPWS